MNGKWTDVGCLAWVALVLALSAGGGWLVNQGISKVAWIPGWISVVLSVVVGFFILVVLCAISYLIIIALDKSFDDYSPDFSGKA